MKQQLQSIIGQAVTAALTERDLDVANTLNVQLDIPRKLEHGDYSTNVAMVLAKPLGKSPRELAAAIVEKLANNPLLERAEIAGPGFINLHIASAAFMEVIGQILTAGEAYGRSEIGSGKHIQIEFVSANPTGPLHVGHGRGAAYGAVLGNIFAASGYRVSREYYVNDAGRQMDILALSVFMRYLETVNNAPMAFPGNAYQGDYIVSMAKALVEQAGDRYKCFNNALTQPTIDDSDPEAAVDELIARAKAVLGPDRYAEVHRHGRDQILGGIRGDLTQFGVEFDNWFAESSLAESNSIEVAVTALADREQVYEKDGARWFKSMAFGDEKDRVLVRDNGSPTYFASDVAYHADKYQRGFDQLINIWGADHHGYISRVRAAIEAIGLDSTCLEILLVQFAVLFRDGEKVPMSTRSGEFVTLSELITEVGRDAARFFYITRRSDQHLDFDLNLAKSQSNENPVYYVQYAHARICQIISQLGEQGYRVDTAAGLASIATLDDAKEKQLAVHLMRYPELIETAVRNREPHLITTYLRELAASFHGYYHSGKQSGKKVISDDASERNARIVLILAVKQVLANGLELLDVSAPESM